MNGLTQQKNTDLNSGTAFGLIFIFLGLFVFSYPFIVSGMADSAKIGIRQRAMTAMREHPEKKVKLLDFATPDDIAAIRRNMKLDIGKSVCIFLSFFVLFPLGLIFIAWSASGASNLTIGELAVSSAAGYVGYKVVKKILS